jgi:nucleotide-binding universal stress UspA family protein
MSYLYKVMVILMVMRTMFTNILLPIDGSEVSEKAVRGGVKFAKEIGARVTAFHVIPVFHASDYAMELFAKAREEALKRDKARATALLRFVQKTANAAGVDCDFFSASGDEPFKEIIKAAERVGCDLIVMASHGRRGIEGVLLGSQTHKVLTHSHIPVLVYR